MKTNKSTNESSPQSVAEQLSAWLSDDEFCESANTQDIVRAAVTEIERLTQESEELLRQNAGLMRLYYSESIDRDDAAADIELLSAAVRQYGDHLLDCNSSCGCWCGWDDIKSELEEMGDGT